MVKRIRDEFNLKTKNTLAGRVGYRCSNPNCGAPTHGPQKGSTGVVNLGEAAHITAASPLGARFNPDLSAQERKDFDNGIWLCRPCAKKIDNDRARFTEAILRQWKRTAEERADREVGHPRSLEIKGSTVRTWLDTVINPMIGGLEREQLDLTNRALGWEFWSQYLRSIWPACAYVDPRYRDNIDQLLEYDLSLKVSLESHHQANACLFGACQALHLKLRDSPFFIAVLKEATIPDAIKILKVKSGRVTDQYTPDQKFIQSVFSPFNEDQYIDLMAQYTINNPGELRNRQSAGEIWDSNQDKFLVVLANPAIITSTEKVRQATNILLQKSEDLLFFIVKERKFLADMTGEPIVVERPPIL